MHDPKWQIIMLNFHSQGESKILFYRDHIDLDQVLKTRH